MWADLLLECVTLGSDVQCRWAGGCVACGTILIYRRRRRCGSLQLCVACLQPPQLLLKPAHGHAIYARSSALQGTQKRDRAHNAEGLLDGVL